MSRVQKSDAPVLHLCKLAVGADDVADIRDWQAQRAREDPPLRHRTRNFPRRGSEILGGGSLYWVVRGAMIVRQRVLDLIEDKWDDGTACAGIVLDPTLVLVEGRLMRPFQGWRYLTADAAPADLDRPGAFPGESSLPPALRQELRTLCLL